MFFPPLSNEDLEHVLEQTRSLWEQLRGKRLFITGATGFFGIWLLETFSFANEKLGLGAELVGLTRNPAAFAAKAPHIVANPSISFHQGDVRDFEFPSGKFSHVIHAGTTSSGPVPPLEMLDTITQGTRRVLDFSVAAGVKRFLFISSGAVYGQQPSEMTNIPETYVGAPDPMNPASAYGEGKRVGELLCALYHQQHGLEPAIARCFAFVGPHLPLNAHFAIGNFIRDAMNGIPIEIKNGAPSRSYLYAADLAIWLWTILFKGQACHPYNVGSDQEITIADLAKTVPFALGVSVQSLLPSLPNFNFPPSRYVPDTSRAKNALGLESLIGIQESIKRTANWHSNRL